MEIVMTVRQASASMDLRLNKGASADFDSIWPHHKKNAFNKAVTDLVRRLKRGKNQTQEGDEETDTRVDDLQVLLKKDSLTVRDRDFYAESGKLPSDYLYFKRLTPVVSKGNCLNIRMKSKLGEEANVDELRSVPSFDFEETFHTLIGNRVHIYHFGDFKVNKAELTYYRKPKVYDFKKLDDEIEFNDSVCELLIDEACKILASDIESLNQKGISQERGEYNN
jgi:hypothetical protein